MNAFSTLSFHWRLLVAAAVGIASGIVARAVGGPGPAAILIGWNAGAVVYLAAAWRLFLTAGEAEVRTRAARQDESRGVILALVLMAIAASLGAIIAALIQTKGQSAGQRQLVLALAVLTMASSWFVLQALFTAHYAHRHFQAVEARGAGAGFLFPGDPPASYLDFAYLAICIGATAQISDPSVATTPLRNLVTTHAVTSFFFNTAVLALGINILSGLIGH
ncbi:MAG: DUF1345 domain-containing protein [Caulobacteraceae bacterium]